MRLLFVTGNEHKFREFVSVLGHDLHQHPINLLEIQGTSEEIVRHKAEQAFAELEEPCLVEDTALSFHAWNGLPGPYIKDFNKKIGVERYYGILGEDKRASVSCFIAYHDGKAVHVFEGRVDGTIVPARAENGFDFDRVFVPEGFDKTYSEMSTEEKNSISHRGRALEKLKAFLESR